MPVPDSHAAVSVLLLAGGRGQRVGGEDKGLLLWRGEPLIAHLYRHVRGLTDDLILSCNRNVDRYAPYADRLVHDDTADFPGPMAGIRAGLRVARHPWLLVLPCDTPGIDASLLDALITAAVRGRPSRPVVVRQGGQWEPLLCVLPVTMAVAFEMAWHAGERSPRKVILAAPVQALDCPAGDPRLANRNTLALLTGNQ